MSTLSLAQSTRTCDTPGAASRAQGLHLGGVCSLWEGLHSRWRRTDRHLPRRPPRVPATSKARSAGHRAGLRTFNRLLHRPVALNQQDRIFPELLSLCGLPSPSTGPSAGSLGQWVPAPGTTHHARELPLWWWCRLLWAWGEDSRAQVWNTVLGQPLLPALLPRARPPDQDSTLGSTLELLTAQCLWKDHQTGNQKKGFWVPFCPSVGLWPHSVPRINVSGLPLPDVTSELPSKYSSFLPTPFPALKTVSSWQHLEPPGPGHSHLSLFLAPPSPNPSQMPLLPGSQVAGLRPGGGRAGRRVRGRPQS